MASAQAGRLGCPRGHDRLQQWCLRQWQVEAADPAGGGTVGVPAGRRQHVTAAAVPVQVGARAVAALAGDGHDDDLDAVALRLLDGLGQVVVAGDEVDDVDDAVAAALVPQGERDESEGPANAAASPDRRAAKGS